MPSKKATTLKKKRRSYKKKRLRGYAKSSTVITRGVSALPDRIFIKMNYSTLIGFDNAAEITDHVFYGNSIFDPDFTGAGHSVMGYDQWANFYSAYRVRASAVSVDVTCIDGLNQEWGCICIIPSTQSTAFSVIETAIETPRSKLSKWVTFRDNNKSTRVKHYATTAEIWGIPPERVALDDGFAGAILTVSGSNPANEWFWHVPVMSRPIGPGMGYNIKLTYWVELYNRVQLAQS